MRTNLFIFTVFCLLCTFAAGCSGNGSSQTGNGVDVDLTVLSSTMIYAEVYNMMKSPKEYMGKTIKMRGLYYAEYEDETGNDYFFVVVTDATACCPQGVEFKWNGEHVYPGDYPKEQTEIEVTGVLGNYDEFGETYYYLAVDDISILK